MIVTPDQRVRVFVSSTLGELADERAAVKEAVASMRLSPILFELGAHPHPPRDLYRAYLEQSHVFLGIYWQSYGWVAPGMDVSGIEDEYLLAKDMPRLIYVRQPASDRDPRLEAFLDRVRAHGDVCYKAFSFPEELHGLVAEDLAVLLTERFRAATVPAKSVADAAAHFGSVDAAPATNLPVKLSSFVGREFEREQLAEVLDRARLVTLTGAGGVGKTRLALQLAADRADRFDDGVWLVKLASVSDRTLVARELASVLRVGEQPGRTWIESVLWYLRRRETLLVLDNCEHLLDEVASLAETVLESCPRVRVLVTSREALTVPGEAVWHVAPLSVSGEQGTSDAERLFVDRAREVDLEFQASGEDTATIAQICRRLDGIPLAIELAAARARVLSVAEIADRLDHRFRLLTGGSRTALPRQRTLEATVAWSYELLGEGERRLFERLSVFAGSFTLDAVEQVCADGVVRADAALDLVTRLVDRSMLVHERAGPPSSYRLLDTMRAYGRDRLNERGELRTWRNSHLAWVNGFARSVAPLLEGQEQELALDRVGAMLDEIRGAVTWALDGDGASVGLECAANLFWYWYIRGVREGRQWLDRLLAAAPDAPPETVASALLADGTLILEMGDHDLAATTLEESLGLYRQVGDDRGAAHALRELGRADWVSREPVQVKARLEGALRIFQRLGDTLGSARTLHLLGMWEAVHGDTATAVDRMDEQAVLARHAGMPVLIAHAAEFCAATHWRASRHPSQVRPLFSEALQTYRRLGSPMCAAHCVETTAAWAFDIGAIDAAARLLGATQVLREDAGTPVPPPMRTLFHEATREHLLATLGHDRYRAHLDEGRLLNLEGAIDAALAVVNASPTTGSGASSPSQAP